MTEEKDETLEILKILVAKITKLEQAVYDNDNILMKAGFVQTTTPSPKMQIGNNPIPDADRIAKMSWDDINSYVTKMEG